MKRKAYFAGKFYPSNKDTLQSDLKKLYKNVNLVNNDAVAIITPHAGYVYSGDVSASAYSQVNKNKKYKNIFILAGSHRIYFNGASTYSVGNYETPLGEVKVNTDLCKSLIENNEIFSFIPEAHVKEHSIEVQLPFLQVHLDYDFQIVPIIVGADNIDAPEKIANALEPYFNEENLFIVSSDFSHYPKYNLANVIDEQTADAICSGNVNNLITHLSNSLIKEFNNNLDTCLCSSSAVNVLMRLAENKCDYNKITYQNSGDIKFSDKDNVVGYWAISLTNKNDFSLSDDEKIKLLKIAKESVQSKLENKTFKLEKLSSYSENLKKSNGVFVSLYKKSSLRACIGMLVSSDPLVKSVSEMAIQAAFNDSRFMPLSAQEFSEIEFEISVLSSIKKIKSIDEIILGKHGIYLVNNSRTGAFLPQVAVEAGWSKQEFLANCASEKLGLEFDAWKSSDIFIFEAIVFSETDYLK